MDLEVIVEIHGVKAIFVFLVLQHHQGHGVEVGSIHEAGALGLNSDDDLGGRDEVMMMTFH